MIRGLKSLLRRTLPAPLVAWLTRSQRVSFSGPFDSWALAAARASGYDSPAILERVIATSRAVRNGEFAYERDSVGFVTPAADPVLLAELTGAIRNSRISVLDFGGSLGSSYHQHRPHLPSAVRVDWRVVEQPNFVAAGRREFSTDELRFHESLPAALGDGLHPDLFLLGSVLAYLEDPSAVTRELLAQKARRVVITRTPFHERGPADLPVLQRVPASIYPASYPAWILSRERFSRVWREAGYALVWHETEEGSWRVGSLPFTFHTVVAVRDDTIARAVRENASVRTQSD